MPGYVLAYACKSRSTSVVPARVHACASMQGSLIKASCTSIMDTASKAKKCRLKSGNQVIRNMGCEKVSCARPACNNLVGLSVGNAAWPHSLPRWTVSKTVKWRNQECTVSVLQTSATRSGDEWRPLTEAANVQPVEGN
eukprot:1157979-Pelagomonas_calceolata.AAC.8